MVALVSAYPVNQIPLMRQMGRRIKLDTAASLLTKLDREARIVGIGRNDVGLIDLVDGGRSLNPMMYGIELESCFEKPPKLGLERYSVDVCTGLWLKGAIEGGIEGDRPNRLISETNSRRRCSRPARRAYGHKVADILEFGDVITNSTGYLQLGSKRDLVLKIDSSVAVTALIDARGRQGTWWQGRIVWMVDV
jgi:hypothetical protein